MARRFLRLVLPDYCQVCGRTDIEGGYCDRCRAALPRHAAQCHVCGVPAFGGSRCGRCQIQPPPIVETVAPFRYAPPLSEAVHKLKYHRALACGRDLGLLLARELEDRAVPCPDALVPVPLHWRRRMWRGFNQSLEIARQVSAHLGVPVRIRLVERRVHTPRQVGLMPAQRRRNIRGVFRVTLHDENPPRRVAIIDDVITSGATVSELAGCLRRAGVAEVFAWALMRA